MGIKPHWCRHCPVGGDEPRYWPGSSVRPHFELRMRVCCACARNCRCAASWQVACTLLCLGSVITTWKIKLIQLLLTLPSIACFMTKDEAIAATRSFMWAEPWNRCVVCIHVCQIRMCVNRISLEFVHLWENETARPRNKCVIHTCLTN